MTHWDPRALAVLARLQEAGFQAVLVGGCVRDALLGQTPHDFDAATSARPEQVLEVCRPFHCLETGRKHGTITVVSDHLPVEVTTFRRESGYSDHRRPDRVIFTPSLTEDLARRDFTINAMAWDSGTLVDPFDGQGDLQRHLIRCVGDPDLRFREDALRPLRGLRLAAQLDFFLEEHTARAIRSHIPDLSRVAWERISAEFLRLLCSPGAPRILLDWPDATEQIVPELAPLLHFSPGSTGPGPDLWVHTVRTLEGTAPRSALRLAALLHDAGKPSTFTPDGDGACPFPGHDQAAIPLARAALQRLRLPRALQEQVVLLISCHHLPVEDTPGWARHWLSRLGEENLLSLLDLMASDRRATVPPPEDLSLPDRAKNTVRACLAQGPCLTLKDLAVNGRDAMAAGLQGKAIGRALQQLLDAVLEGDLPNERDALCRRLHLISSEPAQAPADSPPEGGLPRRRP